MTSNSADDEVTSLREEVEMMRARVLTPEQMKLVQEIIEQESRVRWFWATVRTWALAISAIVAGLTVGKDFLKSAIRGLIE